MDKLKTATGKEFECAALTRTENRIYIRVCGSSIGEVANIFSDPRETEKLWYNDEYLSQYTQVAVIVPEAGCIRVGLRRA